MKTIDKKIKKKMTKKVRSVFSELGKKGGKKNAKLHGKKYMQQIGKMGALKRWGAKKKVACHKCGKDLTHKSDIKLVKTCKHCGAKLKNKKSGDRRGGRIFPFKLSTVQHLRQTKPIAIIKLLSLLLTIATMDKPNEEVKPEETTEAAPEPAEGGEDVDADIKEREEGFNKELRAIMGKYELGLRPQAVILNDGRIGSGLSLFSTRTIPSDNKDANVAAAEPKEGLAGA